MAVKVGLDTMVWIHWISDSDDPEHELVHDVMKFLLDVKEPAEIMLDMIEVEIEYKIRTNEDLSEEEQEPFRSITGSRKLRQGLHQKSEDERGKAQRTRFQRRRLSRRSHPLTPIELDG